MAALMEELFCRFDNNDDGFTAAYAIESPRVEVRLANRSRLMVVFGVPLATTWRPAHVLVAFRA